jgi:hypothetical protein
MPSFNCSYVQARLSRPTPTADRNAWRRALAIAVWWLLFSRARWFERVGAIVLMVVAVLATKAVAHESMVGAGQGMLILILPAPYLALGLVAWAVATRHLQDGLRRASLVVPILLVCGTFVAIRTSGVKGGARSFTGGGQLPSSCCSPAWRRAQADPARDGAGGGAGGDSREHAGRRRCGGPAAPAVAKVSCRSGGDARQSGRAFRPGRDGVVRGVRITTDWAASPPVEMWRRPIGPGWSSFAVHGDLLYPGAAWGRRGRLR